GEDAVAVQAWFARIENIVTSLFGRDGTQARHLAALVPGGRPHLLNQATDIQRISGLLIGALDDLEHGFLANREMLLVGEVFDSVLQQAKHLLTTGYKDVAAVLGRVVIE